MPDGTVVALTPTLRKAILKTVEEMAESALRCLALAQKVCVCLPSCWCGRELQCCVNVCVWRWPCY